MNLNTYLEGKPDCSEQREEKFINFIRRQYDYPIETIKRIDLALFEWNFFWTAFIQWELGY